MNRVDKIAVCSRSFSKNLTLRNELLSRFSQVKFNDDGLSLNGDSLVDFLSEADGAIIALEYLTEEILSRLPNLKFVGKYGVGLDKIDLNAMEKNNIKLGWTPGVNSTSVAELTLAMALCIVRKIPASQEVVAKGDWKQVIGKQLSSLNVGIIGYGHVGKKVADRMNAFGCNVYAHDIEDYNDMMLDKSVTPVSLQTLFKECDLVSIHVPHNKSTHHLVSIDLISTMKAGSYIICTARGGIIDEDALLEALNSGQITAAALDVFEVEPPISTPLINNDKVLVTSHIGGSTEEAILAMGQAAINGLEVNQSALEFKKHL